MASEALHGEAEMNSTSSAPAQDKAAAEMSGIEAATSSVDEKNPISNSSGQQAHVSDANAEVNQQNGDGNGDVAAAAQAPLACKVDANVCGVCEINPGKYKCSRCRLP